MNGFLWAALSAGAAAGAADSAAGVSTARTGTTLIAAKPAIMMTRRKMLGNLIVGIAFDD